MPLVDRFSRRHNYLRIAVTDRCNLRCVYCMPAQGIEWKPRAEILTLEEILRIAQILTEEGVSKIRLTGGEPTVRANLCWLIRELAQLDGLQTLAMTTNGITLTEHAAALKAAGLHRLNISLDTLRRERFQDITMRDGLHRVLAGIDAALKAGFELIKLNVVIINGLNDDECFDFVEFVRARPLHIRFIEFMPFPGNNWSRNQYLPWRQLLERLSARYDLMPTDASDTSVARGFAIPGYAGTVSFISPLSEEFCANCNRLRLTADGSIKSCLLYPAELNLREQLRAGVGDEGLLKLIQTALNEKHFAHPQECALPALENRCMSHIGG
ncbi:GTP 3',8-cyclase MoaA [candidate division KSB1 bacterium]|nr:GTP 3',8-cyclase MoaA [candidate division KSB1 bacterium]